jgi:hypothetical protein
MDGAKLAFKRAMRLRRTNRRLLVRCQMGWNRSGLIAAGILIAEGHDPQNVIETIRDVRGPDALGNVSFVDFLLAGGFSVFDGEDVDYVGSIIECHGPATVTAFNSGRINLEIWDGPNLTQVRPTSIRRGLNMTDVMA